MPPTPLRRPRRGSATAAAVLATALALSACSGGSTTADQRAAQVRQNATKAGLPKDVADVLALGARGATATYRITYAGSGGAALVVTQRGTDHRIDVMSGTDIVESRLVRNGVAYTCDVDTSQTVTGGGVTSTTARNGHPGLTCKRAAGDVGGPALFDPAALATFSDALVKALPKLDLQVTHRTIAGTRATCLISTPKAGVATNGTALGTDTLCLADNGAQLLVDTNGQRLEAQQYTTNVPTSTFDV